MPPAMYYISETRYNPRTQRDEFYYRIKESFRDLSGRPRHRLMLTVGFIEEDLGPYDVRDIGRCLTWLHEHQGEQDLFGDAMSRYKEVVRRLALQYWQPGFHAIYNVAPSLYELKDRLESHLCRRTDHLFNITNRIVLFDLTNFYFEVEERESRLRLNLSREIRWII